LREANTIWTVGACLLIALTARSGAQSPPAADPNGRMTSTMTGVYSAEQATRGEATYMSICVSCHPAGTYTAPNFKTTWNGRPLSELYDLVKDKMPKNDPGSLTPGEYIQSVAYLLKINGVPAGKNDLPADSDQLKKIRIELPSER
jgi:cytochrome c5